MINEELFSEEGLEIAEAISKRPGEDKKIGGEIISNKPIAAKKPKPPFKKKKIEKLPVEDKKKKNKKASEYQSPKGKKSGGKG